MENNKRFSTKMKITVLFISTIFVLSIMSSLFYISENEEHNCIGEGCQVCHEITVCSNTLQSIASAAGAFTSVIIFVSTVPIINRRLVRYIAQFKTLFSLKVMLII